MKLQVKVIYQGYREAAVSCSCFCIRCSATQTWHCFLINSLNSCHKQEVRFRSYIWIYHFYSINWFNWLSYKDRTMKYEMSDGYLWIILQKKKSVIQEKLEISSQEKWKKITDCLIKNTLKFEMNRTNKLVIRRLVNSLKRLHEQMHAWRFLQLSQNLCAWRKLIIFAIF